MPNAADVSIENTFYRERVLISMERTSEGIPNAADVFIYAQINLSINLVKSYMHMLSY